MSAAWRNRLIGFALAVLVYLVDQWLKHWVKEVQGIDRIGEYREILPFFDLRFTQNFGISLGMFQATSPEMTIGLIAMTGLISLVIVIWMLREKSLGDIIGLSLILGGAIGNIRDRYAFGYVIDYADFHIGTFRPFMIFNLADAAITVGVLIILVRSFFLGNKDEDNSTEPAPGAAESQNA